MMKKVLLCVLVALLCVALSHQSEFMDNLVEEAYSEVMAEATSQGTSCTVTASSLNVRSGPATYNSVVTSVRRGQSVSRLSTTSYSGSGLRWTKISANGRTGYVASKYLSCSGGSSSGGSSSGGSSSGGCQLFRYRNSVFQGKEIIADKQWKSSLDRIASYARSCGVKIHVTSSYRKNSNVSGAIVTPAKFSNHMVGQAIDMNVVAKEGWCNSSCLRNPRGSTKCFIDKIKNDRSMRWGGAFNDPVHIDSGLNVNNRGAWNSRYQATQRSYLNRCY